MNKADSTRKKRTKEKAGKRKKDERKRLRMYKKIVS